MTSDDFVSDVKNNLAVIIGFAQLISHSSKDERILDFCKVIKEQSMDINKAIEIFFVRYV